VQQAEQPATMMVQQMTEWQDVRQAKRLLASVVREASVYSWQE